MIERNNIYRLSNRQIALQTGKALQRKRINNQLTQKNVADHAGVKPITVVRAEKGNNISFYTFIALLRATEKLDILQSLLQEEEDISPALLFKLQQKNKQRKRVRLKNTKK
jgi:transcriptional regulator with XRE-family HTH domain